MIVNISPRRVAKFLIIIIVGFTLIHCILQVIDFGLGINKIRVITTLFNFERDSNVTTWYSSIALFISSLLLWAIALTKTSLKDPFSLHWKFLAIIFAFLSLDEVAMFHERAGEILGAVSSVEFGGWLYFQWVLIGIPVTLIIALVYLKFIAHLPAKTRNLFILAGALFVGGALGLEILAGHQESITTDTNLIYKLITTVEELWEKLGVMVFIYALLSYMEKYANSIQFQIGNSRSLLVENNLSPDGDREHLSK